MDKYFVIAGEKSGDDHGSKLINAINKIEKSEFIGIGGDKMINEGLYSLYPLEKMAVMGFIEVIKHLKFFKKVEKKVLHEITKQNIKAVILIDYPGFNLRISKKIKVKSSVPIIYYITPQLWAWKESRIKYLKRHVDEIITIFPFEKKWYKERNLNVHWVGHPYLDTYEAIDEKEAKKNLGINNKETCIALFPGSREQEINRHLKLFINSANIISYKMKNVKILLHLIDNAEIKEKLPDNYLICRNKQKDVFCASKLAIIASGTATIEATIFSTPMVVVYKMNFFTWLLSKIMIKTKFIAMPNIIANKLVVPEIIQHKANQRIISMQALSILNNATYIKQCIKELDIIKYLLNNGNASKNAAEKIKSVS